MLGRYEENAYFMRMLKVNGHKDVTLYELQGYGHGMFDPAVAPMLRWMQAKGSQEGLAPKPTVPPTQQPASTLSAIKPSNLFATERSPMPLFLPHLGPLPNRRQNKPPA